MGSADPISYSVLAREVCNYKYKFGSFHRLRKMLDSPLLRHARDLLL